ncbi:MAG TPA: hypothetical protein VJ302_18975 [Blastocatellia bacterium]|nr:hypothetical protein [Blastocatellia bacterium]
MNVSAAVTHFASQPTSLKSHKFLPKTLGPYGNSPILVIFHGVGGTNPNDFQIKERFVVLDGFDAPPIQMRLHRGRLSPAVAGDEPEPIPPPKLIGDGIVGIGDDDSGTAVFWYQGKYCWYPVEKYSKRKPR